MTERLNRLTAGALVVAGLAGGPVVALAENSHNKEDPRSSSITVSGEMPSQQVTDNLGVTLPRTNQIITETTPSPPPELVEPRPEVTPAYKTSFKEQLADPSIPIETLKEKAEIIRQAWILENYGPYMEIAKQLGLTDKDEIWFTAKDLYTFENAKNLKAGATRYQSYLTYSDILKYPLIGEDEDVIKYEGSSLCRLVMPNFSDKGKDRLRRLIPAAIDKLEGEGINIVDSMRNGSGVVFYIDELQPETGYGAGLTGEWGVFNMNLSEKNIKSVSDKDLINQIAKILRGETFGIDCDQLLKSLEITDSYGVFAISNIMKKIAYSETIKYNYIGEEFITTGNKDFVVIGDNLLAYARKNIKDHDLSSDMVNRLGELVDVVFETANTVENAG